MTKNYSLSDITSDKVVATTVPIEFFTLFMEKLADQGGNEREPADPYVASFIAFAETSGIEPGSGDNHHKLQLEDHLLMQATIGRFYGLVALEKADHLKHWSKDKGDHTLLHPALIAAACKTQLLARGNEFYFQPLEFLNNALNAATPNEPF